MRLSSAYLYDQIKESFEISGYGSLSGRDGYLRPFLCGGETGQRDRDMLQGHVCVIPVRSPEELAEAPGRIRRVLRIFCGPASVPLPAKEREGAWMFLTLREGETAFGALNCLQRIFDCCDEWDSRVTAFLTESDGIQKIIQDTSDFLGNPLMVMGVDFSLAAEAGAEKLPERARLFLPDGINLEYMNALVQNKEYQGLANAKSVVLFPAYISGCRSMNRNLYVEGQLTHRLVLTEYTTKFTDGCICILEALTGRLEYLLARETPELAGGDLEAVFQRLLTDRTADYLQVSQQLSAAGWSGEHEYLCMILQITYLNQKQLSTRALCRHIKNQLPDSISFLYRDEVVTFFNLTRLGLSEEETAGKLVYFIRDTYLKAGYSRTMKGHMNLRRQYVQARTALDVGSRKKPYLWIHHFSQVALTYIIEQSTRRLPGYMLCHEGLLRLRESDEQHHTEYLCTLKTYLEQHLNATQTAKELFIHRSTFLYRLEKMKEILRSDLEDPDELFYLELSIRLLEQEAERGGKENGGS